MADLIIKKRKRNEKENGLRIVVSKKVSKKAVDRNLIKRRIRSIFREFTKQDNKEYTVIVKPSALNLDFKELKNQIKDQIN